MNGHLHLVKLATTPESKKQGSLYQGAMQIQSANLPDAFKLLVSAPGYNMEMVLRIEGSGALKVLERFEEGVVDDPIVGATLRLCDGLRARPKSAAQRRSEAKKAYWNYVTGRWTSSECENRGPAFIITKGAIYGRPKGWRGRATLSDDSGQSCRCGYQNDAYSSSRLKERNGRLHRFWKMNALKCQRTCVFIPCITDAKPQALQRRRIGGSL